MNQIQKFVLKPKLFRYLAGVAIVATSHLFLATSCVPGNDASDLPRDSVAAFVLQFHKVFFEIPTSSQKRLILTEPVDGDSSVFYFNEFYDSNYIANNHMVEGAFTQKISLAKPVDLAEEKEGIKFSMYGLQSLLVNDVERVKRTLVTSGLVIIDLEGRLRVKDFQVLENCDL